jgi:hypothetical protein
MNLTKLVDFEKERSMDVKDVLTFEASLLGSLALMLTCEQWDKALQSTYNGCISRGVIAEKAKS